MRAVAFDVRSGGSRSGKVVDADQLVVASAGIDTSPGALAEIVSGAERILVDIAIDRADGGEGRALPVDTGVDVAEEDAFTLGGDARGGHAAPDRRCTDEARSAIGIQFKQVLALDEEHVGALHDRARLVVAQAHDDGIERVLHAGHDIERPVQGGAQIVEEGLLLDLQVADIGLGRRRLDVDLAGDDPIAQHVARCGNSRDAAVIGGNRRILEDDRVVGRSLGGR